MSRIITSAKEIDFSIAGLPKMPVPGRVLMVKPTYFDVEYIINPHMKGMVGAVDKMQAQNEWEHLKDGYEELGFDVHVLMAKKAFQIWYSALIRASLSLIKKVT